ncbi:Na+/H+ antiporter subunit A [Xylanibacillus composti]|uniref:Na+/H+ antiporter subunit A n=1 Tax=Xylanibacillus composti TaxID=1572762 RepID=A0A8J4H412_9BACL|nr:Na+/H+ antiporter subunit A [Xylanibacillus composti]MDT9725341.1 Na+/H+ antiporter subunit A [Xylanibacillus composti]GIQ69102.1 Na+/H+ antiporter subunit A [Xylanibacillus composti]
MSLLHFMILTPFVFAVFVPLFRTYMRNIHTGWFVLAVPLILFSYFASHLSTNLGFAPVTYSIPWIEKLDIHFTVYLDGLSLLLSLIITAIGALVIFYSIYYMSKERESLHNFYIYLLMFMGAMLGVVLSDNLMVLYLFWELTSVASFLLIAYWFQRQKPRYGAQKSMLITITGGFFMLLGFLLVYAMTGTFSLREIIADTSLITEHALFVPAMLLILFGAFTKSAQFPFHIWLPDAMEAPTPISAYLHSATMVKAGVYLVARFTPVFGGTTEWFWIIASFGIVTLFWGSFMAIRQSDLKALLAYSTISQLGLIMSLLGIGSMALHPDQAANSMLLAGATLAAVFHLFNHSMFKGCLFMVIGILDHETGTRDIRRLGGLMSLMPVSFTLTVIGGLSMAGLPPFSGFLSKEMFFTGVLSAYRSMDGWVVLVPVLAWVASILTFVYSMILIFRTFTGPFKQEQLDKTPHEAPFGMLLSPLILASIVVITFFFPNLLSYTILEPAMHAILPSLLQGEEVFTVKIKPWHGWNTELFMTLGVVAIGALLYIYRRYWSGIYEWLTPKFSLNHLYDRGLVGMENMSARITRLHMTGYLRDYLAYVFAFLIFVVGGSLIMQNALRLDISSGAVISIYEYVLGISIAGTALFVVFSNSRLISIITVGAIGYIVSLFFVIFRAPDLALTQLVVETMTTAIFLLCFYFLPKLKKEITRIRFRLSNFIISLGVGVTLTLIGLSVQNYRLFEPISSYFEESYTLAGAKNMVNAILVDFRAFDTMLEIVVLFIAGAGVFTLIKLRQSRRNAE